MKNEDVNNFLIDCLHYSEDDDVLVSGEFLHIMHGVNSKLRLMESLERDNRDWKMDRDDKLIAQYRQVLVQIREDVSVSDYEILALVLEALEKK